MSYGSAAGVAAHVPRHANESGRFDNTTVPTLAQVDAWRREISGGLDVAMAAAGLPSPASDPAAVGMLDGFVNGNVAWLADSVNGQGRYQERPATTQEILAAIATATGAFVKVNAAGFGALAGIAADSGIGAGAGARVISRVDTYSRTPAAGEYSG